MLPFRIKIEWKRRKPPQKWSDIPAFRPRWILWAIALSLLLHFISLIKLHRTSDSAAPRDPVHFRTLTQDEFDKLKDQIKDEQKNDEAQKRMVETPLNKTAPPKDSRYAGPEDHATEKETRVTEKAPTKGLDPGQQGFRAAPARPQDAREETTQEDQQDAKVVTGERMREKALPPLFKDQSQGSLSFNSKNPTQLRSKPRTKYENLLPTSDHDLAGQMNSGYQDLINDDVVASERIDLNTTSYRYIGYFTAFRKQIELVWIYPSEAVEKGFQGEVQLEIVIQKNGKLGRVRILRSSGYPLLDRSMVQTIEQSAPFPPLPASMNKERLVIVGSFRYILRAFAG